MFKIKQTNHKTYNEIGQTNPIRWKTLFKEADNSFTDQSGWIKCRDFYNDTVAFFKEGSVFSFYNYQNDIKKNDEGVYFLLNHIKEPFYTNIEVMNLQLKADLGCVVVAAKHSDTEAVILIPNELWESTYRISMVTMCIRLCNYGVLYNNWQDFWCETSPAVKIDGAFDADALKQARKYGFNVAPKFSEYWYYAGKDYNSKVKPKQTGDIIHNNGVCGWTMWMKKELA